MTNGQRKGYSEPAEVAAVLRHLDENDKHQQAVHNVLREFCKRLDRRGETHDYSKTIEPELSTFVEYGPKLKTSTYGSDEYKQFLEEMKVALDHHYAVNSHHPEFYKNGVRDMNLIDLLEMFADWYAAVKRHDDGDILKSISINQKRFNMSHDLTSIFMNTAVAFEKLGI